MNDSKEEKYGVTSNIKEAYIQYWLEASDITLVEKHFPIQSRQTSSAVDIAHAEAETETEHALVTLWERILKTEKMSVIASFFTLGGSFIEHRFSQKA